jgi:hypothetical protein
MSGIDWTDWAYLVASYMTALGLVVGWQFLKDWF